MQHAWLFMKYHIKYYKTLWTTLLIVIMKDSELVSLYCHESPENQNLVTTHKGVIGTICIWVLKSQQVAVPV